MVGGFLPLGKRQREDRGGKMQPSLTLDVVRAAESGGGCEPEPAYVVPGSANFRRYASHVITGPQ